MTACVQIELFGEQVSFNVKLDSFGLQLNFLDSISLFLAHIQTRCDTGAKVTDIQGACMMTRLSDKQQVLQKMKALAHKHHASTAVRTRRRSSVKSTSGGNKTAADLGKTESDSTARRRSMSSNLESRILEAHRGKDDSAEPPALTSNIMQEQSCRQKDPFYAAVIQHGRLAEHVQARGKSGWLDENMLSPRIELIF